MAHLLVRAGLLVSLIGGVVVGSAVPAAAGGGVSAGEEWPPIKYVWCYDIKDENPYTPTVTVCTPV